jgi:hypothetical protein
VSIDARLKRLAPTLSAKERAMLVLRSLREKTAEDPAWRSTMPRDQTVEFNRLIVLMNACNIYLPLYITMVEQSTERLFTKLHWLITMTQFGSAFWDLASLLPAGKRKQAEKLAARSLPRLELPWVGEEHELSWLNLAENMERGLREELILLGQDLRAIDSVVDSVSMEFDGEDPLRPVMRGIVEKTRSSLTQLHEFLSLREPFDLPEPDDEALELAQTYFENGRRLMQSL